MQHLYVFLFGSHWKFIRNQIVKIALTKKKGGGRKKEWTQIFHQDLAHINK